MTATPIAALPRRCRGLHRDRREQRVNVAIGCGVSAEQALAEAGVRMEPAAYQQLMRDIDTRPAHIAQSW